MDRLTCFVPSDGDQWTPIDRTRPIHAGIAVCSVVPGCRCQATFEDVTVVSLERAANE